MSLRSHLILIVLVAIAPVLFFSGVVIERLVEAEVEANKQLLVKTADELALALDQEIIATVRTLQGLAEGDSLKKRDLKVFHQIIVRVLKNQASWSDVLLHDPKGHWLLSAGAAYGTKLADPPEPKSILETARSKKPEISKIISVPSPNHPATPFAFAVRVPVLDKNGEAIFILSAILSAHTIQELVSRYAMAPGEWVRAITDTEGTLAARSRDPEKFVGAKASGTLLEVFNSKKTGGLEMTTTLDGISAYTSYRQAPFSKWYSAVAVPEDILEAKAKMAQYSVGVVGLVVLLISLLALIFLANWMRQAIISGSEGAAMLARGETPEMKPTSIREIQQLRNSLLSASKLLQSRDRAKSEFLANMSHELRTPLGIILGMNDLISKNMVSAEDLPKSWEIVDRNGQQLLRLINDILDLSKIEANKLTIESVNFSLPDLVSAVVEDFTAKGVREGVEIRFVREPRDSDLINSDPVRVRQVVVNLLGNAVKFTPKGSIVVTLHTPQEGMERLTFKDSGIGLSEEQKQKLFTDFTQGDSSHTRKYGGTGLGLSLSRKLAHLLGGDVQLVASGPNEGSTFELRFMAKVAAVGEQVSDMRVAGVMSPRLSQNVRILLAEDSPDNVALIKNYLKNSGISIVVAENGVRAMELAEREKFDLILMDLQMPEMDGYEAARKIRERGNRVPIVALTAHALADHRVRALQSGFSSYLTKPVRREHLLREIDRNLGES